MKCKVKIINEVLGVFPQYQPKVGEIYEAEYIESIYSYYNAPPICVIDILGKKIIVRKDEFEIVRY